MGNLGFLRWPTVSHDHVAFVYADDVWVVAKSGGVARKFTSARGRETFPRFSPDGRHIALSGSYDSGVDVYCLPLAGGIPVRLTHHPEDERLVGWIPEEVFGRPEVLLASSMQSGRPNYPQLFRVSQEGELPRRLPLAYASYGAVSVEGRLAFQTVGLGLSTWKGIRTRASEIFFAELVEVAQAQAGEGCDVVNLIHGEANDSLPMWSADGSRLYFLSDRGGTYALWVAYELDRRKPRFKQLTFFSAHVRDPSIGPEEIVFTVEGKLYLLPVNGREGEEPRGIPVEVPSDRRLVRPRRKSLADLIRSYDLSPTGKRAAFEARGEIFSLSTAREGVVRNLSLTPRNAERYPAWSPDGCSVAYWTDRTGEYELAIRNADGSGNERILTKLGAGYRYRPFWSPDSRRLAFIDHARKIRYYDLKTGRITDVDQASWIIHYGLERFAVSWSPCGRWLAYTRRLESQYNALFLYDTEGKPQRGPHQVTSGFYSDREPVFDPAGRYLFFLAHRTFPARAIRSAGTWIFDGVTRIAAVALREQTPDLWAPSNQEEACNKDETEPGEEGSGAAARGSIGGSTKVDLDGFERRIQLLPEPVAGNFRSLAAVEDRLLFCRDSTLQTLDLKSGKVTELLPKIEDFCASADGRSILTKSGADFARVELRRLVRQPGSILPEERLRTDRIQTVVDPRDEWRQILDDAWRLLRDYFFDGGRFTDDTWRQLRDEYRERLRRAATRWDLDYLLDELAGELNTSHARARGGDLELPEAADVGLLGADFEISEGGIRVARVLDGAAWDSEVRSPLLRAGVAAGELLLAVNGVPIDRSPWCAFAGLQEQTVELAVGSSRTDCRRVIVRTLSPRQEQRLRYLAWVERRRKFVAGRDARIGYIHVRGTKSDGFSEFLLQLRALRGRAGLIIDVRFSPGGHTPFRFLELLARRPLLTLAQRFGEDWLIPDVGHFGPKAMLINRWTASAAELLAYGFRELGLGTLIGMPTNGGTVGTNGTPALVDGGRVYAPSLPSRDDQGNLIGEGRPIEPHILVEDCPFRLVDDVEDLARDPQLVRAIGEVQSHLPQV